MDYGYAIAFTTFGTIGVKVWIFRGMYGEEVLETDVRPGGGLRIRRSDRAAALSIRIPKSAIRNRPHRRPRRTGPPGRTSVSLTMFSSPYMPR